MKKIFFDFWIFFSEGFITIYQNFFSPLFPNSCRYYPTCSQYALWILRFNHPFIAVCKICKRILKCNQFFKGGIDYPIGYGVLDARYLAPQKIIFWLIPLEKLQSSKIKFYIIKSL
ncbi:membrane protein insertion efficiency factor YidD [Helicobacter sp. 13S00477-4]|uniref:membrane protein insertion efficiency factor YidD n=1 Tax=Helicobacter sp. 13S00477-4 TaxID=1905759 RepID=UPI000BA79124|nr:membrane protein insertion efficiency factor YidD [Helicobacter sp. 13S00477-4]PAF52555.1 membrane protein insertion efficiency factor YidD [Helicobacter sp. 13S00477-4]